MGMSSLVKVLVENPICGFMQHWPRHGVIDRPDEHKHLQQDRDEVKRQRDLDTEIKRIHDSQQKQVGRLCSKLGHKTRCNSKDRGATANLILIQLARYSRACNAATIVTAISYKACHQVLPKPANFDTKESSSKKTEEALDGKFDKPKVIARKHSF
jgi:hypothetical protein